ncbi:MAG: hypothetical protein ACFHX7_04495 [Pseudomonadota bacterium]
MEEAIIFTCGLMTLGAAAAIQRAQKTRRVRDLQQERRTRQ